MAIPKIFTLYLLVFISLFYKYTLYETYFYMEYIVETVIKGKIHNLVIAKHTFKTLACRGVAFKDEIKLAIG